MILRDILHHKYGDALNMEQKFSQLLSIVNYIVGNGNFIKFWNLKWIGNSVLWAVFFFLALYEVSAQQQAMVGEMRVWEGGRWL